MALAPAGGGLNDAPIAFSHRRGRASRSAGGRGVPGLDLPCKSSYDGSPSAALRTDMSTLLVSSKGQIVLPAALRRRLGMGAGARIEVIEESDGLKLRVVRPVATTALTSMVGMAKAPARGVPRRLEDFDPASMLTRSRRGKP